jgi:predicted metalloprotease
MKWRGRRTSDNIEDRRGGMGQKAGIGIVGLLAIMAVGYFFGVDITPLVGGLEQAKQTSAPAGPNQIDDQAEEFVGVVLADTEEVWTEIFQQSGLQYREPALVLFSRQTVSACGGANAAMGPFYCPNDQKVYLDTEFFRTMQTQMGAKGGDFAKAYVIAHEIGHNVQDLQGILSKVNNVRRQSSKAESNALSVRIELQADCYAGLWAKHAQQQFGSLEPGDIEDALDTASKIGDDALQRAARGVVVPDSFTHGTSKQRQEWFYRGYKSGDPQACDTFEGRL